MASKPTNRKERINWKCQALAAERLRFESIRQWQHTQDPVRMDLLALGVAHEFNNILGAALGHAEWALETHKPEDMKESLEVIRIACIRCAQITKSLQGIVQPREEQKSILVLKTLFAEVKRLWQSNADKGNIELEVPSSSLRVYMDPSAFIEIFSNLLKNSFEVINRGPKDAAKKVTIVCVVKKPFVIIRYEDTGPGVPEVYQNYLFQPFFTTKGSLGSVYNEEDSAKVDHEAPKNTGLGLFLSKALAQELGGDLKYVAEPSRGAIFELSLPLVD